MKRLLCLLLIGTSITAWTQADPPIWVHDIYRRINHPQELWHTGFVQDRLKTNEDASSKLRTMERDAINQLAESIIITIESETQTDNINQQQSGNDNSTNFRQKIKTATSATLINLDVNSYYDPSTGIVYAFAAIKRSDLSNYYQKQIIADLNRIETAIEIIRQHIIAERKSSARSKIKEAKDLLNDVRFYRTMISVNTELNESNLQPRREDELHRALEKILIDFNMDIIVFLDCQFEQKDSAHDAFENDHGILCDIIMQALNENECIITADIKEADFILTLITSTTQRSGGNDIFGILSYYANVKGSLYDCTENKYLVNFNILNDPNVYAAGRSPEDAATKAFKLPALKNMIMEKILHVIIMN